MTQPADCGRSIATNPSGGQLTCTREAGHPGQVHWFLGGVDQGNGTTKFGLLATHPRDYTPTNDDRAALAQARALKDHILDMARTKAHDREDE